VQIEKNTRPAAQAHLTAAAPPVRLAALPLKLDEGAPAKQRGTFWR
jgi:hypothetical protein